MALHGNRIIVHGTPDCAYRLGSSNHQSTAFQASRSTTQQIQNGRHIKMRTRSELLDNKRKELESAKLLLSILPSYIDVDVISDEHVHVCDTVYKTVTELITRLRRDNFSLTLKRYYMTYDGDSLCLSYLVFRQYAKDKTTPLFFIHFYCKDAENALKAVTNGTCRIETTTETRSTVVCPTWNRLTYSKN